MTTATATALRYRYAARSTLTRGPDGGALLGLRTSGDDDVALDAVAERGDVLAAGLLRVADVALRRFDARHGGPADAAADPVLTVGEGALRVEALSPCAGVGARLDVLPEALRVHDERPGTAHVDAGPALRHVLAGVRGADPLRVRVGARDAAADDAREPAAERLVEPSERWVRSVTALHVRAAGLVPVLDVDVLVARRFLDGLHRLAPAATSWVAPAAGALRLVPHPVRGAFGVAGAERLQVLAPLLRLATGLRAYAPADPDAGPLTCWELALPGARLVLALSPSVAGGFDDAPPGSTRGAPDDVLAAGGHLGHDLATGRWFDRRLPFGAARAHPDLATARRLVLDGGVLVDRDRAVVRGTGTAHLVRIGADGPAACTCAHAADGPCVHVLAVRIALADGAPG